MVQVSSDQGHNNSVVAMQGFRFRLRRGPPGAPEARSTTGIHQGGSSLGHEDRFSTAP